MERLTQIFKGEYKLKYGIGIHETVQRLGELEDENAKLKQQLAIKQKVLDAIAEYERNGCRLEKR